MKELGFSFDLQSHWVSIAVRESEGKPILYLYKWENLPYVIICKYRWYFRYRAALLQVKYPKYTIDYRWGTQEPEGIVKANLERNRIISRKAQITKYKNKLAEYEKEFDLYKSSYCKIFPIEDETEYKTYKNSIKLAKSKIKGLELELGELMNS